MSPLRLILATGLVLLVAILGSAYENDHLSCVRSDAVRSSLRVSDLSAARRSHERSKIDRGQARVLDHQAHFADLHAAGRVRPIDCATIFPGTR